MRSVGPGLHSHSATRSGQAGGHAQCVVTQSLGAAILDQHRRRGDKACKQGRSAGIRRICTIQIQLHNLGHLIHWQQRFRLGRPSSRHSWSGQPKGTAPRQRQGADRSGSDATKARKSTRPRTVTRQNHISRAVAKGHQPIPCRNSVFISRRKWGGLQQAIRGRADLDPGQLAEPGQEGQVGARTARQISAAVKIQDHAPGAVGPALIQCRTGSGPRSKCR